MQIALLYRCLEELTGSPVVTVNRAVALAEIAGQTERRLHQSRLHEPDARSGDAGEEA